MIDIQYQPTPNPNSMKFTLSVPVVETGSESYMDKEAAEISPLASALFEIDGVSAVFMLGNFITVTKEDAAQWEQVVPAVGEVLEKHFA